ncbi:MAG: hypothetical protein K0U37_09125 [Gammaproteobacteria bacterium]|nr:hypothetical protein [Gammaproteobacteria bacterium]
MLIYIGDLDRAEVIVKLYNAAPSPSWMTNFTRRNKSQYELARDFFRNRDIKNEYFIKNIDLGRGLKSIKINFRGPNIDVSTYNEHLNFFGSNWPGTVQELIDELREEALYLKQARRPFR